MNIRRLIVSFAVIVTSSSAFAESQTYPYVDFGGFQSSKTRAEVTAELEAHRERASRDYEYPAPAAGFLSSRTRAEVVAELRQSIEDGTYAQADFETTPQIRRYVSSGTSSLARTEQALDPSK